ncbi:TIR domain-containing protein [Paenibacillus macerans]|uniref:TIR domain-containing protein n=1 Tax=Paenibacillus macerans TaxID=44252 RepID=UPI000EBD2178|nr:TIR domain-containing protein [Paenibacillus macerans]MBS5914728.1 TIR domain-containing protein [Paenibacillus macerans]MEC0138154.1 TIR domain-containing protein [Paenibacillus macerans]GBK66235.1 TIR domain-containing protein [Paenibacillus macerans]GBK72590.1 TIR domain-containing protein [Paenibacillus macerans]GIP12433.1 hypothetical protein J1TS5_46030 [Paenibacillus macerans]
MALFTRDALISRANLELQKSYNSKTPGNILSESYLAFSSVKIYDIFLSHSFLDAKVILGLKKTLEDMNYAVYVDWIDDRQLSRNNVNAATANQLRQRMKNCKSLFFATSDNSSESKWMPWELGYFDGLKNKVAILPITTSTAKNGYEGQEYLGLYDYADNVNGQIFIRCLNRTYKTYKSWLEN